MIYKTNKREKVIIEWFEEIECDICKLLIEDSGPYSREEVKIEGKSGDCYPEDDNTTIKEIDCCYSCYEDKIIPLIEKTFSLKFRERASYDYTSYIIEK